jgi:hypothetical protein
MASFPVPASGEIRVLYGGDTLRAGDSTAMKGAMAVGVTTIEAVKSVVAAELAYLDALNPDAAALGAGRGPLTRSQADTLTRRLGYRTNEIFDYVLRGQAQAIHDAMKAEMTSRGVDEESQATVLAKVDSVLNDRLAYNLARTREIRLLEDSAYARAAREAAAAAQRYLMGGLGGFSQFYLDGRASFRSRWLEQLRIVPQATLGISSTTTAMIGVSAQYHGKFSSGWTPYVGLGIGALVRGGEIEGESGTSFVVNPLGSSTPRRARRCSADRRLLPRSAGRRSLRQHAPGRHHLALLDQVLQHRPGDCPPSVFSCPSVRPNCPISAPPPPGSLSPGPGR